ncbi:MAG TPA: hypothetical protein VKR61_05360 [Bryobacteraceae bacterium]|nr:hypothetical protein [Bryobacteraceae bacterium]
MATTPVPTATSSPEPALIVAVPSDPASAAAFAAGNLFVFLCTPVGQKISSDAETAGKAIADVVKGLAQDVVNIFRGIHL